MKIESKIVEVKKTYNVDGVEYTDKGEALKAVATKTLNDLISQGVDAVIENYSDFIKALRILSPSLGSSEVPPPKPGQKGTLNWLDYTLSQKGMRIIRSKVSWPVYHIFLTDGTEKVITFKKEVWALCKLYEEEGIQGLLKHQNQ